MTRLVLTLPLLGFLSLPLACSSQAEPDDGGGRSSTPGQLADGEICYSDEPFGGRKILRSWSFVSLPH